MTEPLVSVKMITYNHAPFIAQAIEGVLQQKTNFPFELVIGEDCSTDGTREIVFEYQKKYPDVIRVITSDQNIGMKKNGYRTIKACRGKYIAFCEGDDYWHHPEKLQKQVDYLERHPECSMLFGDCDVLDVRTAKIKKNINYTKGYQSSIALSTKQIIEDEKMVKWTCTVMARRDLIEKIIESDPYLHQSEHFLMGDTQLWAELALVSEVTYMPETWATYRILDESVSNSKDVKKRLKFWISVTEMRLYLCDKHKLSENIRKKAESLWFDKSLQLAFYERNTELAMEIKRKKQRFTWKEWLRYLGAKNVVIHYGCRAAIDVQNFFKKRQAPFA